MKGKQFIALLLSVLLVVAGLPVSALAAHSSTASASNPTISISVKVNKEFKGDFGNSEYDEDKKNRPISYDPIPVTSTKGYMDNLSNGGKMFKSALDWKSSTVDDKVLTENVTNVDNLFKGKTSETIQQGGVVYVGVKFDYTKGTSDYLGAVQETAYIIYPSEVFEPDVTNYPIAYHAAIDNAVLGPDDEGKPEGYGYVDKYSGGKLTELWLGNTPGSPYVISKIKTVDSEGVLSEEKDPDAPLAAIGVMIDNSSTSDFNFNCTNPGTWDVVIPLKAKADAEPGTYEIGFERYATSTTNVASGMTLTKAQANNGKTKTAINESASTTAYLFAGGGEAHYDNITYTKASVTVQGAPAQPGEPTVTYENNSAKLVMPSTSKVYFNSGMEYKIGTADWAAISGAGTASKTTKDNDTLVLNDTTVAALAALGSNAKIILRSAGDDDAVAESRTREVTIAVAPGTNTAPEYTADGKIKLAATQEYSINTSGDTWGTWTPGVPAGTSVIDNAGKKIKYRVKGTSAGIPGAVTSGNNVTIPSRQTTPDVAFVADATIQKNGKSKISGASASMKMKIGNAAESNLANITSEVTQDMITNGFAVRNGTTSTHISFYLPGTTTGTVKFDSVPVTLDGTATANASKIGNQYGTITAISGEITNESTGAGTVTVTLVGDTFTDTGNWSLSKGTVASWTKTDTATGGTATLTVSGGLVKDEIITVTAPDGAFTLGGKESASESTFEISDSGYKLVLDTSASGSDKKTDNTDFAINKAKIAADANEDAYTVTVTGFEDGWSLGTVTVTGVTKKTDSGETAATISASPVKVTGTNTFKFAPVAGDNAGSNVYTVKIKVTRVLQDNVVLVPSVATKVYDGTKELPEGITFTAKTAADGNVISGVTVETTSAELTDGAVGSTTVKGLKVYDTRDNAKTNKAASTGPDFTVTAAGMVTASTATSNISFKKLPAADNEGFDAAMETWANAVAAGVKAATPIAVTVAKGSGTNAGANLGKIGDYLDDSVNDDDITQEVLEALLADGAFDGPAAAKKAHTVDSGDVLMTVTKGDTITIKGVTGDSLTLSGDNHGAIVDMTNIATLADGVITLGTNIEAGTTLTISDGGSGTWTVLIGNVYAVGQTTIGPENLNTTSVDVTLEQSKFSATKLAGTNYNAFPTGGVTVTVNLKRSGGGGGSAPAAGGESVNVEDKHYGVASTTVVELDEDNKIVSLPKVTDVVKGATFVGWSTNGKRPFVKVGDKVTPGTKLYAVYDGYMVGDENNNINADKRVTRAELIKMLVVAIGQYNPDVYEDAVSSFKDAQSGWYAPYIACAQQLGMVDGYEDGTVRPNAPVTREEAAKLIAEAFGVEIEEDASMTELTDFNNLQGWAKAYVKALYGTGAIDGYPDGTYRGSNNILRDASAKMINVFLGLTPEAKAKIAAEENAGFDDMVDRDNWAYADLVFASLNAPAEYYSKTISIPTR